MQTRAPRFSAKRRARFTSTASDCEGRWSVGERIQLPQKGADGKDYKDEGIIFEPGWGSVDKVMDPKTKLFYSSKPPLLTVLR